MLGCVQVEHLPPGGKSSWEHLDLDRQDLSKKATISDLKAFLSKRLDIPKTRFVLSEAHRILSDDTERINFTYDGTGRIIHLTSYVDLVPALGARLYMPNTADRGISLAQLRQLCRYIFFRSLPDATKERESFGKAMRVIKGWHDIQSDKHEALLYETINLYQVSDWIIKPMTKLEAKEPERALLPHEDPALAKQSTDSIGCSYVEAVAVKEQNQRPSWFVSHAWNKPVVVFVKCLEEHCRLRQMSESTAFWVCAYANNQHALGEEISYNPRETSFFRAMTISKGVLVVLDSDMTPFSRIWCCYETSVVVLAEEIVGRHLLWDIAIPNGDGVVQILSDGVTADDLDNRQGMMGGDWNTKSKREESFPIKAVLEKALEIRIEDAIASVSIDRDRILNSIAGRNVNELDFEYLHSHPEYARVNAKIQSMFAVAAWRLSLSEFHAALLDRLVDALHDDTYRRELRFNFEYSEELDDRCMERLGAALPEGLKHLVLKLDECKFIGDSGVAAVAINLGKNLTNLTLSISGSHRVGDSGVAAIAESLPHTLQSVNLNFSECLKVRSGGVMALAKGLWLLHDLKVLVLDFGGCDFIDNDAFAFLSQHLASSIELLDLDFMHCGGIQDSGVASMGDALDQMRALRTLKLNFNCCKWITEAGAAALAAGFPESLASATVHLRNTRVPRSIQKSCEILESMHLWLEEFRQDTITNQRLLSLETSKAGNKVGNSTGGRTLAPARPAAPQTRITVGAISTKPRTPSAMDLGATSSRPGRVRSATSDVGKECALPSAAHAKRPTCPSPSCPSPSPPGISTKSGFHKSRTLRVEREGNHTRTLRSPNPPSKVSQLAVQGSVNRSRSHTSSFEVSDGSSYNRHDSGLSEESNTTLPALRIDTQDRDLDSVDKQSDNSGDPSSPKTRRIAAKATALSDSPRRRRASPKSRLIPTTPPAGEPRRGGRSPHLVKFEHGENKSRAENRTCDSPSNQLNNEDGNAFCGSKSMPLSVCERSVGRRPLPSELLDEEFCEDLPMDSTKSLPISACERTMGRRPSPPVHDSNKAPSPIPTERPRNLR